jgi:hypothetical protein
VRRVHGLALPRRNRSPLSVRQDDGQRQQKNQRRSRSKTRPLRRTRELHVKTYPRSRAARQPPPHLPIIAGAKARNRSPRPTRKTGTRFSRRRTRRRTRRRNSDDSRDGAGKRFLARRKQAVPVADGSRTTDFRCPRRTFRCGAISSAFMMIHQGETITPASVAQPYPGATAGGGNSQKHQLQRNNDRDDGVL